MVVNAAMPLVEHLRKLNFMNLIMTINILVVHFIFILVGKIIHVP